MSPSQLLVFRLVTAAGLVAAADPGTELQVLRVSPGTDAAPTAAVTVTFDRPVAGSLDRSVDPEGIFRIEPTVRGRLDWRDPVTLRFRPDAPLPADASYTITVSDRFEAMDGSRLRVPYVHRFRVRGPRILASQPITQGGGAPFLTPDTRFELVVDAPLDTAQANASVYLEFNRFCRQGGVIRLRVEDQRPVREDDRWDFREAGGWDRDRAADPLRRVVRLAPRTPLPLACSGELVVPSAFDDAGRASPQRWPLSTYGPLRVVKAACGWEGRYCPTGPVTLRFSTPVRGADVIRRVQLRPSAAFTVSDTADSRPEWVLETELRPRTGYAVVVDPALTDAFGQRLRDNPVATLSTTGYAPSIDYPSGRAVVERVGGRTFGLSFVNVDTLEVLTAPVPDSLEPAFLARSEWNWRELWPALRARATRKKIAVPGARDRVRIYGVPLTPPERRGSGGPSLMAVQVTAPGLDSLSRAARPIALLQVTDLGIHARIGAEEGVVWVTGASDGRPRRGTAIVLHDASGRELARAVTDSQGIARLTRFAATPPTEEQSSYRYGFQGYVVATLGDDRALLGISEYDPDLSPWRFNVGAAWGTARLPVAAAVFTERGIYRPGEPLFAKAIVRTGPLGALAAPARSDSLRWIFHDRADQATGEAGVLRDTTVGLSEFGTAEQRFPVPAGAALGEYGVSLQLRREGRWQDVASTYYRVAEYRPPEFLVDVRADSGTRFAGDSVHTAVEARYLFGAPMGRAATRWTLRRQSVDGWELEIPGTDGFYLGETGWWYEEYDAQASQVTVQAGGTDTLDAGGRLALTLPVGPTQQGKASRATFEATVTDVNRQTVSASTSILVHPAAFYLGLRPAGKRYFWTAGEPTEVEVIAVRPDGGRVSGVHVDGTVVRREWHQVRRERAGYAELVGEWVSDTVARCSPVSAGDPVPCRFTPPAGGSYIVTVSATDEQGREARSSVYHWAVGKDWVPWNDESQFKMDVVPDKSRYAVGDTATILFASPFTGAEAWITVEREGLIEQRRLRIASGTTTISLPITEALAPNAFVSIVVARGRSAPPGPLDDPGRPTIRVGYAELRVTPERKRLAVTLTPGSTEYRPGDTARVALQVRDAAGAGQRSEVTLWAVDEGVLALTGYRTPDPIDLIYRPRGLGMRLASTLTSVTPQVPEGIKGKRAPGGGGGADAADILRSRFQTTAFFLGSVVTGADGRATAVARLPDNLTTFRLMAVAVTAGDRYGSGQSSLLVTRPLVARPALPRFLRDGDRFAAGVVVNRRDAAAAEASVEASARGIELRGKRKQTVQLEAGRGREVRFEFRARPGDSAGFRFDARSGRDADAVALALPLRPSSHPRAVTVSGVLRDSARSTIPLPVDVDPERSSLQLSLGSSPLGFIRGAARWLQVYPYACSEQLSSSAEPLVALYRAGAALGADTALVHRARRDLETVVATLTHRQRDDGGIGLWSSADWTTPWLTAYAGSVLLEAKAVGLAVDDSVLARLGDYLHRSLTEEKLPVVPVMAWYGRDEVRLSERVMAVDYLSRAGLPDRAAENELLRMAAQLAWEDRVHLASVFARRGDRAAATRLLEPAWASVKVEGRTATLPAATVRDFYFYSRLRPTAWLLAATLAVDPAHPLVGPLVETLIRQGETDEWVWNTQDYGTAVDALAEYQRHQSSGAARSIRVTAGGRTVFEGAAARDSAVSLKGLVSKGKAPRLELALRAGAPDSAALFYFVTVTTLSKDPTVRPGDQGIQVERWYERYADGEPVTEVAEGELVRVRLKVKVPAERHFVVLDDALPAGLEAVDLSLRTVGGVPGPGAADTTSAGPGEEGEGEDAAPYRWAYGMWDAGWWSPFDHRELRDDRVVYAATVLWKGEYTASYLARATTPGRFTRPPAHAEEMYNPAVYGESDGGIFTVVPASSASR
ncbi:MAG TPA: alpha-2-macroglobulin family protein [Gemmatimonadales bacterium]|nr:alpha-2-macroglobulin family protein [Gemmatimonadales bacterium]